MATAPKDNDDLAREAARTMLDTLRNRYWDAKKAVPQPSFDDIFDLRKAYEDAAVEYAGLEGRLLRDDILTSDTNLKELRDIKAAMKAAVDTKAILGLAARFIKQMVALA